MSSKQREALLAVYDCAKDGVLTIRESAFEKVMEAIAEPLRNCDIGTEREQSKRFDAYCYAHRTYELGCGDCPLLQSVCCELAWAQLPYEEGEAERKMYLKLKRKYERAEKDEHD